MIIASLSERDLPAGSVEFTLTRAQLEATCPVLLLKLVSRPVGIVGIDRE